MTKKKLRRSAKKIMINQIENKYKIGDEVYLKKGTLLHGTYKNIEGLDEIVKKGLIASIFINARTSKYPSSV